MYFFFAISNLTNLEYINLKKNTKHLLFYYNNITKIKINCEIKKPIGNYLTIFISNNDVNQNFKIASNFYKYLSQQKINAILVGYSLNSNYYHLNIQKLDNFISWIVIFYNFHLVLKMCLVLVLFLNYQVKKHILLLIIKKNVLLTYLI